MTARGGARGAGVIASGRPHVSASGRPLTYHRRLIVLRHGITEHNAAGIWQGHLDTMLSATGELQAVAAASALKTYRPDLIVSSDLARAGRTAQILGTACGVPVAYDERLREIHAGAWQGMSAAQVAEQFPEMADAVNEGVDVRRGGTGETVAEVAHRAREAADDILGDLPNGHLAVIVTHGVAARALVADLVGMDQRTTWLGLSGLGNCHWGELREHGDRWRLFSWNHSAADEWASGPAADDDGRQSAY